MKILNDLADLVENGIINQETALKIEDYYQKKKGGSTNRLFVVFAVLGAILVGLGIILIIAHNWDELSRLTKTIFAFIPLVIGQILCGYSLLRKNHSVAWSEGSASFLFFALGATISLVSQIYNIPGNLSSFLLTWLLLSLPLLYLLKSSISSLLYIIGTTYYACEIDYFSYPRTESYWFWILLALALPHYYLFLLKKQKSNFTIVHNWLLPLGIIIMLGTVADKTEELMFIAYMSLFGLFYGIGNHKLFKVDKLRFNS